MNIVATNTYLYKCKIVHSNLCDFCSTAPETVKHLFWQCNATQHFWSQLSTYLNDQNVAHKFDWYLICFGQYHIKNTFLNLCILLGKYFIYICKLKKSEPVFSDFKNYLKRTKDIEKTNRNQ